MSYIVGIKNVFIDILTFDKSFFIDFYLCLYFSLSCVISSNFIQLNSLNNVFEDKTVVS